MTARRTNNMPWVTPRQGERMVATIDYAVTAMALLIASVSIVIYLPMFWWVDLITVPFGGLFSLAVLDRLSRGE